MVIMKTIQVTNTKRNQRCFQQELALRGSAVMTVVFFVIAVSNVLVKVLWQQSPAVSAFSYKYVLGDF